MVGGGLCFLRCGWRIWRRKFVARFAGASNLVLTNLEFAKTEFDLAICC